MTTPPPDWQPPNILGLRVYRDTNILDHGRRCHVDLLLRLREEGWLELATADIAITETNNASEPAVREALAAEISTGFTSVGPQVHGDSPLWLTVRASDQDERRLHVVHRLIWNREWEQDESPGSKKALHRLRDTMHVATAIRYGGDVFITDDKPVVDAADKVAELYTLRIYSAARALTEFGKQINLMRRRWEVFGYTPSLPDWPTEEDIDSWSALR